MIKIIRLIIDIIKLKIQISMMKNTIREASEFMAGVIVLLLLILIVTGLLWCFVQVLISLKHLI